jgi:ABC-type sugar transport system permease subunit
MTIVAVSLVFQTLFSTQYGVVNQIFHTHIQWMENYAITRWVVVLMLVWQGLGFWFVVFLAGLTSIDPSLEEAAIVDGASVWQRLRFVIIPLMRNIFLFAFAIDAISSMRLYTQPNVLVSRASLADPEVAPLLNLLVSNLQGGSFGQSAAVGWLLFIITIAITAILFGVFRVTGAGE